MKSISLAFVLLLIRFACLGDHLYGGTIGYEKIDSSTIVLTQVIYSACSLGAYSMICRVFDGDGNPILYQENGDPIATDALGNAVNWYSVFYQDVGQWEMIPSVFPECSLPPSGLCKWKYTVVDTFNIAVPVSGLIFTMGNCCRVLDAVNLDNSDVQSFCVFCLIPGELAASSASPIPIGNPPLYLCLEESFSIQLSATDADGDSLSYQLYTPFTGFNPFDIPISISEFFPVVYANGYDFLYPMDSSPSLALDPVTGILTGTPTQLGHYVLGYTINEYRDGILIGSTLVDFDCNVIACGSHVAAYDAPPPCSGLELTFNNTSLNTTAYSWDFGIEESQEDTSTAVNPVFVFPEPGMYQVTLVSDPETACADTTQHWITVAEPLLSDFSSSFDACDEYGWNYEFVPPGTISEDSQLEWTFENGQPSASEGSEVQHVLWDVPGTFESTLIVSNAYCADTSTLIITIEPPVSPVIDEQSEFCQGLSMAFDATAPSAMSYLWDFGVQGSNSDQSAEATPVFVFPEDGSYTVYLVVNEGTFCQAEDSTVVEILSPSSLVFSYEIQLPIPCDSLHRIGATWTGAGADQVTWNFGDGYSEETYSILHEYDSPGIFYLEVSAGNDLCNWQQEEMVEIVVGENLNTRENDWVVPTIFTPNGDELNDQFGLFYTGWSEPNGSAPEQMKYLHHYELKIYNRWGQELVVLDKEHPSWDGKINGEFAETGTYFFTLKYQRLCGDNEPVLKEGAVWLQR